MAGATTLQVRPTCRYSEYPPERHQRRMRTVPSMDSMSSHKLRRKTGVWNLCLLAQRAAGGLSFKIVISNEQGPPIPPVLNRNITVRSALIL